MTKYTCLSCGLWLPNCKCQEPVPSENDDRPLVRGKRWTRAEVTELLATEAREREVAARAVLVEHVRTMRRLRA